MSQRLVTSFPHQDPAVLPIAQFFAAGSYLPNLDRALHAIQDTETALLGVVMPSRPGGGVSTARQLVREAAKRIHEFIRTGGLS